MKVGGRLFERKVAFRLTIPITIAVPFFVIPRFCPFHVIMDEFMSFHFNSNSDVKR
jgi:hypothetical protein